MKVQKFTEELKTTNFSDLEEWSGKKAKIYTGTKTLDLELGSKVIELLHEYDLGIISVDKGDWIQRYDLLLPNEINLKEYRVHIGKKQSFDDFIDTYEDENDVEYKKLSSKKQEKIRNIYDSEELIMEDNDDNVEFSVFLPNNIQNINEAAMSDASTYLKLLIDGDVKSVTNGNCDDHIFLNDTKEVINFINLKKIEITNKNLDFVPTINYRLYKDSKVFVVFEDLLGKSEKNSFFKDWSNLLK